MAACCVFGVPRCSLHGMPYYPPVLLGVLSAMLMAAPSGVRGQLAVLTNPLEERQASRGETYSGRIIVANPTGIAHTLRVSRSDSAGNARSNAQWVTLMTERLVIPPRSEGTIPFSVRIPADSLQGTYWSRISLEPESGAVTPGFIEIATHVGASGTRSIAFGRPDAVRDSTGAAVFELDVTVTGDRGVRPRLTAEAYDSTGVLKSTVTQAPTLLYPGSSHRPRFDFGNLSPGTYQVRILADPGGEQLFVSRFTIVF
jgi:hypothetical protein